MVFCLFQESLASVNRLVAILFNFKNLGLLESYKCVICCTQEAENTIRILCQEEIDDNQIDFFPLQSMSFGTYITSWIDFIRFALEKYGEIQYFNDDIVLFRLPKVDHLTSGIGFLKKPLLLPETHYNRLFSRDFFYCNNLGRFNDYANVLLQAHDEFTSDILETENTTQDAASDDNREKKSPKTVQDYLNFINESEGKYLNTLDDENTAVVTGQFLSSEDFFGAAREPITFKDVDYSRLVFSRNINQQRHNDNEAASIINQECQICGFFIRSSLKVIKGVQANERMGQLLQAHFPKADPLLLLRTQGVFPLSYPPHNARYIAHWDRRGEKWHEGLIKLFKAISNLPFVKSDGLLYRFTAGVNPIICEPSTKYLSPDLITRKDIMIANLNLNSDVIQELDKVNLPYSFVFYYPEDCDVLEEVLLTRSESATKLITDRKQTLFVPSTDRNESWSYAEYLNNLFDSRYVLIEKDKFNGCVIAEALAAGCCLVLEDEVAVSGLKENVHYISYNTFVKIQEQSQDGDWSNQSKMCYAYYKQYLSPNVLGIRLLRHCWTIDMKKFMVEDKNEDN